VAKELVAKEGTMRLWRGVSTMFSACIPAHAAYFSILEAMKAQLEVRMINGAYLAGLYMYVYIIHNIWRRI
jgi:hypothetical protein